MCGQQDQPEVDDDPTVAIPSIPKIQLAPAMPPQTTGTDADESPSSSSASPEPEVSVGRDNVDGYDRVADLADCLFQLKDLKGALTQGQANNIVALWSALADFDKRPITFSPRHREKLTQGRFKQSKKTSSTPGVDSTKRAFLGQNSGPASWPDANRYMEALFVKLCAHYPSPVRKDNRSIQRWSLIMEAYRKIRDTVLGNAKVMRETKLQLAEVNHKTLIAWYSKRSKTQERDVLVQGIAPPVDVPSDPQPLPEQQEAPKTLDTRRREEQQHQYHQPENTAGMATVRRQLYSKPEKTPTAPMMPYGCMVVPYPGIAAAVPLAVRTFPSSLP